MARSFINLTLSVFVLSLAACAAGGAERDASAPDSAAPSEPAAPEPVAEAPAEEADESPKLPDFKPSEMLTTPDVAFAFDYNNSEMRQRHGEKCKSVQDDPGAFAACLEKERNTFKADVLQFTTDAEGQLVFIAFLRKGNTLVNVFQSFAEFADETPNGVKLKLVGKSKGSQPVYAGQREFPLEIPDKYSLVIQDPKLGELKYGSKVGLVPQPQAQ